MRRLAFAALCMAFLAGCSSAPSKQEIKAAQANFCSLVLQWIDTNENGPSGDGQGAANVQLAGQLSRAVADLKRLGADDLAVPDLETPLVSMTQFEGDYVYSSSVLRRYCSDADITVHAWGSG